MRGVAKSIAMILSIMEMGVLLTMSAVIVMIR